MSDRVSKDRSASAFSKVWSKECFIEVYIKNRCKIIIVYNVSKKLRKNNFKKFCEHRPNSPGARFPRTFEALNAV